VAFLKLSFLMLGALAFSHLSFDRRRKYGGKEKEGKVRKFKYRR
jgi:hypothetical protein